MIGWLTDAPRARHNEMRPNAGVKFSSPTTSMTNTDIKLQKDPGNIPTIAAYMAINMKLSKYGATNAAIALINILIRKIFFLRMISKSANHPKNIRATTSEAPRMVTLSATYVLLYPSAFTCDGIRIILLPYPFIQNVNAIAYIVNSGFLNSENLRSNPPQLQDFFFFSGVSSFCI